MKFTVQIEINEKIRQLEIIPSVTMEDWLKRNNVFIAEIKFPQHDWQDIPLNSIFK